MEDTLRDGCTVEYDLSGLYVLILILMEYTLWDRAEPCLEWRGWVLILILMEHTLWGINTLEVKEVDLKS